MKRRLYIIALIGALLGLPTVALASDISGARYYALIQVSNNSTATTNVATTCNISTQNLIDGNYLNSSANNCVIRTSGGADVPFMPAVNATYPWCVWVPTIGADSYQNDILYTANSTGGEIRYFPDAGGMTTADSASLELGDNFTVEQKGWVNTSYSPYKVVGADVDQDEDVYLYKDKTADYFNALDIDFETYITSTSQDGCYGGIAITNTVGTLEDFAATDVSFVAERSTGPVYNFRLHRGKEVASDTYVGNANTLYYCTMERAAGNDNTSVKIYSDATRATLLDTVTVAGFGTVKWRYIYGFVNRNIPAGGRDFDGYVQNLVLASGEAIEDFTTYTEVDANNKLTIIGTNTLIYKDAAFQTYISGTENITSSITGGSSVTATGVSSGEYTVRTSANLTHLGIYIDGSLEDSTALTSNVTDNSNNWTFLQNNAMPYMEYHKIWIDGVLQQHIEWQYATSFSDQSGNSHNATPTFRTASSDASVSAELVSFQPVTEAQAPDYALGTAPAFIDPNITGNMTGAFTTTPGAGTFPLAGVITAVANATSTPSQLPLLIIAVFIILAASLTVSALMRQYGSGSLLAKIGVIVAFMGIFIALGNFAIDFWMLVVFLIIAVALAFMSKQIGWT